MVLETKYGDFKITGIRLRTALDTVIMLNERSITSFDKEQFYKITKSAPSSHGPVDKLVDMVRFGLLEKTAQTFTITQMGHDFLKSTGTERQKIVEKIIRNISLWNKLLDAIGKNPTLDEFSINVRDITKANADLIERNLSRLYSAYNGDLECISKTPPYGTVSPLIGRVRKADQSCSDEGFVENEDVQNASSTPVIMSITFGDHRVDITDELTYRFAEQMMVMIKKELARRGVRIAPTIL